MMEYLNGGDLMFHIQNCHKFDVHRATYVPRLTPDLNVCVASVIVSLRFVVPQLLRSRDHLRPPVSSL